MMPGQAVLTAPRESEVPQALLDRPRGSAEPISLDAVETFRVNIAPYDLKYSGFTGGSIDAITRSGSIWTPSSTSSTGRAAGPTPRRRRWRRGRGWRRLDAELKSHEPRLGDASRDRIPDLCGTP